MLRRRDVAGLASDPIGLPGGGGGIVAGHVTDEARARSTLFLPGFHEDRIIPGLSVQARLPGGLIIGVADRAGLFVSLRVRRGRSDSLRVGDEQRRARGQQGEHEGDNETFETREHGYSFMHERGLEQAPGGKPGK